MFSNKIAQSIFETTTIRILTSSIFSHLFKQHIPKHISEFNRQHLYNRTNATFFKIATAPILTSSIFSHLYESCSRQFYKTLRITRISLVPELRRKFNRSRQRSNVYTSENRQNRGIRMKQFSKRNCTDATL